MTAEEVELLESVHRQASEGCAECDEKLHDLLGHHAGELIQYARLCVVTWKVANGDDD